MDDAQPAELPTPHQRPALSLAVPCYNEQDCLEHTIPPLSEALRAAGIDHELILVDNGSTDRTSHVIDRLIQRGLPIVKGTVAQNRGQGLGIRTGLLLGKGLWSGYICADGQVAPADVVRIYQAAIATQVPTLVKALRRQRKDGWQRAVVSAAYNLLVRLLFPGTRVRDVNGNPKLLPTEVVRQMELKSSDWFLEAEIVLKARHLGLPILEIPVAGLRRKGGTSHVRLATLWEFVRNLLVYRFGGPWSEWRKRTPTLAVRPLQRA